MQISKINSWMQLIASIGVLVGIILVARELEQNNVLAEAETVNDIYKGWENIYQFEYQNDVGSLFIKSIEQPEDLTNSEIMRLDAWLNMIVGVTARQASMYFRYGLAYDPSEDLVTTAHFYFGGRFARAWFWENEEWLDLEPQVFEIIRREIEARPADSNFEYLEAIRSRL